MIYIGTSGWHYDSWRGPFYPEDMQAEDFLVYYTTRFQTVEINNTFYQLPGTDTFVQWGNTVPEGFIFAVKASRYITHMKKMKDPEEPITNFLDRVETLGDKLGPVLFQLPPRWHFDEERLLSFLRVLPKAHRYAFEFRDPSWFNEEAYSLLENHNAAFCVYDLDGRLSPERITSDFSYVRLHGPDGPYQGQYNDEELAKWSTTLSKWADGGREVYCYFDNDEAGYAAKDAQRLLHMVGEACPDQ